jgi:hypothetical protein
MIQLNLFLLRDVLRFFMQKMFLLGFCYRRVCMVEEFPWVVDGVPIIRSSKKQPEMEYRRGWLPIPFFVSFRLSL